MIPKPSEIEVLRAALAAAEVRAAEAEAQAAEAARDGVALSLSTLADQVGACAAAPAPLHDRIAAHVLAAERGCTATTLRCRCSSGARPTPPGSGFTFAATVPAAAAPRPPRFTATPATGEHPAAHFARWSGILQADAYAGFGALYAPDRFPGPVAEALCWAHARRKFFELADIAASSRRSS